MQMTLEILNALRDLAKQAREQEAQKWETCKAAEEELKTLTDLQKKRDELNQDWYKTNRIADAFDEAVRQAEVRISNPPDEPEHPPASGTDTINVSVGADGKLKVS